MWQVVPSHGSSIRGSNGFEPPLAMTDVDRFHRTNIGSSRGLACHRQFGWLKWRLLGRIRGDQSSPNHQPLQPNVNRRIPVVYLGGGWSQSLEFAEAQREVARSCRIEYRLQSWREQVNSAGVYAASEMLAFNTDDENASAVRITIAIPAKISRASCACAASRGRPGSAPSCTMKKKTKIARAPLS